MATSNGRKSSSTGGRKRTTSSGNRNTRKKAQYQDSFSNEVKDEIILLAGIAVTILLFLCNFHIIGKVGNFISQIQFGLFGVLAYIAPIFFFLEILFFVVNLGNRTAMIKGASAAVLFFDFLIILSLISGGFRKNSGKDIYQYAVDHVFSGGWIGGIIAKGMSSIIGIVGSVCLALILMIVCMVLLTEKSFVKGVAGSSRRMYDRARNDLDYRMERNAAYREQRMLEREQYKEDTEERKPRRMDKKVSGIVADVTLDTNEKTTSSAQKTKKSARKALESPDLVELMPPEEIEANDLDEIANISIKGMHNTSEKTEPKAEPIVPKTHKIEVDVNSISNALEASADQLVSSSSFDKMHEVTYEEPFEIEEATPPVKTEDRVSSASSSYSKREESSLTSLQSQNQTSATSSQEVSEPLIKPAVKPAKPKPYRRPPISLLAKNEKAGSGNSEQQLRDTAIQLKQTLKTFGVNVTITDISQGPAVTRYELQPEMGVKVSKIVNLADDIKLNLAATDIRIEAPIPGKAAIGIEVPNKENSAVFLRDLLDTSVFKEFDSNIAFAVGKDIAGQTIVTDIGKMPHVLIAGSTGSGKSVCINTLIMSILYKASPEDVKLIMVDPKVVELSVYNGIPHLLLPVVTDPKKASAALQWAVREMTDRYKKFEDMHVRDLKGYNKKVAEMVTNDGEPLPDKLPQIVIIVDELADLMMVAPGEVEESICRLAQLARAAGIHLVIATQRPSVDVITGLIKANMPSRIAFAVSSGVDSRTILDMVGAEKLLGKGDMLFYPQGMPKPVRVQGAFVSDKEVADVVDYIKDNNASDEQGTAELQQQIETMGVSMDGGVAKDSLNERDSYFEQAGRLVIDKDKASIGMLQRVFKIGFNRAARIMDQLCEYGVVGEEEGTKPRRVLMSPDQFEQLLEEI